MSLNEQHLITLDEFLQLTRPTSKHLDETEVIAFVREVEDLHIIPLIGTELYNTLVTAVLDSDLTAEQRILFKGGTWSSSCGCNTDKVCAGLKRAVAYLAYARMVAVNGGIVTRTGYYQHNDTYADRTDDKNRANARRDVQNMAEFYLGQCVEYYNYITDACCGSNAPRQTLVRIKSVGRIPKLYN